MKNLFRFYFLYLYYFGAFWGYRTFIYDFSTNKFVHKKKLIIWNRFVTLVLLYSFVKTLAFEMKLLANPEFFTFQMHCAMLLSLTEKMYYIYVLVIIITINQKFLHLAKLSEKLLGSVELSLNDQIEITKKFSLIFLNDIGAYCMVSYLFVRTIGTVDVFQLILVFINYCLIMGFKHITSAYIFTILLTSQVIKTITRNLGTIINRKLEDIGKMESKNLVISLQHQAILYEETIKFGRSVHSLYSFIFLLIIWANLQEVVYGVFFK